MTPQEKQAYLRALLPITSRVRTDVSAIKTSDGSRWTKSPLNEHTLGRHVEGVQARGACPIKEGESVTRLALLDLDSHRGETPWSEMTTTADRIMAALNEVGLAPIAFRSSGGSGIHIFMLWDDPQDAYSVRQALIDVLTNLGLKSGDGGVASGEVEVFPKQDSVPIRGYGNQFILPLAGKSEPLDPLFGLEPMGREYVLTMDWPMSLPVAVREQETRGGFAYTYEGVEPIERVRSALMAIPNDDERRPKYDEWFKLVCAVHEATGGSEEGRELCIEWSQQYSEFDLRFFNNRVWDCIRPASERQKAYVRDHLFAAARDCKWEDPWVLEGFEDEPVYPSSRELAEAKAHTKYEATEDWRSKLSEATDEFTVREKLCDEIAKDKRLDELSRETLAQALFDTFKRLGVKYPIAQCRKLVAEKQSRKAPGEGKQPHWLKGWVYVTDEDKFFRLDSAEWVSKQGFDAKFNRQMPRNDDGELTMMASWYALNEQPVPVVTKAIYLPWADGQFTLDGTEYANTYRPSSVPPAVEKLSAEGAKARDILLRHIELLCNGRKAEMRTLLDWLAHNVQKPGVKIRWAPLIKGIEGDGKTSLGTLLRAVMGNVNVRNVSPKVLGTDFTGWAHGSAVVTLEEIRLTGHSRHDILNALKPYITNDSVEIHAKGKDGFDAINTTNYLAFTNFVDALPLTDTDRRWWILFTPWGNSEELAARIGAGAWRDVLGAYFTVLNRTIEMHRGELRRWLLDHPISPEFNPNGNAPTSNEKALMIGMNVSEDEMTLKEALEKGGVGVTKEVFLSSRLRSLVQEMGGMEDTNTQAWNRLLVRLGYTRQPKKLKWRGRSDPVWVLSGKDSEPGRIREILAKTLPDGSDDTEDDLF